MQLLSSSAAAAFGAFVQLNSRDMLRLGTDHMVTLLFFSVWDCPDRISTGTPTTQIGVFVVFVSPTRSCRDSTLN